MNPLITVPMNTLITVPMNPLITVPMNPLTNVILPQALHKDGEEFKRLTDYVKNTHGSTHTMYQLEVEDVFKVVRQGEEKKFKPFSSLHNRQLLWHGSPTTNFCGILSQVGSGVFNFLCVFVCVFNCSNSVFGVHPIEIAM